MGAGFLLTDGCTITATTQDGTWTPIGDDESKQGTIAWAAGEQPFAELTVDKLDELTMPNIEDRIQIYNTNPDPVNGNFYRQDNLTAPPTIDVIGFDYEEQYLAVDHPGQKLVGTFPVPTTTFTEAMYVLDYAKPMDIPVSDLKLFRADSLDEDGMNYFNPAVPEITEGNGSVALENGQLVYRPATTSWDGYDTFYVFGESDDAGIKGFTANANLWSQVHVIPANNVYYEDTFIESQNGVTVGIEYGGEWSYAQEGDNCEHPESGETNDGGEHPFGGTSVNNTSQHTCGIIMGGSAFFSDDVAGCTAGEWDEFCYNAPSEGFAS